MADEGLTKAEINAIFKRLKSHPANKQCFDCGSSNPTWASVTYGVFVCIDCSAVHRSLGVHITFIRSTQLDTTWTWLQLRAMQVGGNAAAMSFFTQHGWTGGDLQQKYKSRAAQMYRERLHSLALKALKSNEKKLHLDSHAGDAVHSPQPDKEIEFFDTEYHSKAAPEPALIRNESGAKLFTSANMAEPGVGPNVDTALSSSPKGSYQPTILGGRKAGGGAKKGGLGAKKTGGLGAQKVAANFSAIETAALEKEKEEAAVKLAAAQAKPAPSTAASEASLNLAYKELSLDEKKREEKLKSMDPKKKEQMERLGMAAGSGHRGISHSALSDMESIAQESPSGFGSRNTFDRYSSRSSGRDYDDDFEVIPRGGVSSGPPRYESAFTKNGGSSWGESDSDRGESSSTQSEFIVEKEADPRAGRSRKTYDISSDNTSSGGDVAQKKFGNAKAISSDAYFGNERDPDFEVKQNLRRYEGSQSISSAELFGDGSSQGGRGGSGGSGGGFSGSDLADIKEGVRQGVTKVAGRLSNIASGVMSSLQDNYG